MSQTAALYHLQTLDSQIDKARTRLKEIEELLNQNEAVRKARESLEAAKADRLKWKTRSTDLDLERQGLKAELESAEERLYSGKILNPRELTDLQDKAAELTRRREHLEEPLLTAMFKVDEAEEAIAHGERMLETVLAEQAATSSSLTEEAATLTTRLADLEAERDSARGGIEADNLRRYDQLRQRPGGVAVVILNGSECSACGVQVTTRQQQQVGHGEVIPCPTCQRILYLR